MGTVIDLAAHRRRRPAHGAQSSARGNVVSCSHCGESHPIMRLRGGEQRCVTAFFDGMNWFCRNRGCRRAWLAEGEEG
jgi:hypothetical protein